MIQLLNFTTLDQSQKELILSWRNHPDIRKWMMDESVISSDDHLDFIKLLHTKTDRCYFLVQRNNEYLGVVDLTSMNAESAELGIYANPDLRGVGSMLLSTLIDYAKSLGLSRLIANVYNTNIRAQTLYKKFHFTQTKHITHRTKKMSTLELIL